MTKGVTLKGGDRFKIGKAESTRGLLQVRRARRMPSGKWTQCNLVVDPKRDLQWGPMKSWRHYRQAMGDYLAINVAFDVPKSVLTVGELERKGVPLSAPPVVTVTKGKR